MGTFTNLEMGQRRRLYVADQVESAYCTGQTPTHVLLSLLDGELLAPTPDILGDEQFSLGGVATDFRTRSIVRSWDFQARVPLLATLEGIALTLAKALGGVDSVGGSTGAYTHTFAANDLPDYLPSWTIEEHMAGAAKNDYSDRRFLGVQVDGWELTWGEQDVAVMTLDLVGSGRLGTQADMTESNLTIPMTFVTPVKIRTWLDNCGTRGQSDWDGSHEVATTAGGFPGLDANATDVSAWMRSGAIRWRNNSAAAPRQGQAVGADRYQGQRRATNRTCEIELTLAIDDTTRAFALLKALDSMDWNTQTEFTIGFDFAAQTANHGVQIIAPIAALTQQPTGGSGPGERRRTFTFGARKTSAGTTRAILTCYAVNADANAYCA